MKRVLSTVIGIAGLLVALAVPAAAQAARTPAAQADFTCAYPSGLYDQGNDRFSDIMIHSGQPEYQLFFDVQGSGPGTEFCPDFISEYQSYVLYQYGTNRCLNLNSTYTIITEETACGNSWDRWNLIPVPNDGLSWRIQSTYNNDCIYSATPLGPAKYAGCGSDSYEDFMASGWRLS
jgi:hypothetical protein